MSLETEDVTETQKLMHHEGDDEEQKVSSQLPATSPVTSNKMSSGAASVTSKNDGRPFLTSAGNSINDSSKISFVNERRVHREQARSNYNKPKNITKDAPDVKHMEKALLSLLDDFHTGKLSAFSAGCSMEQMINIRDQQENLAKLHFRLCADVEKPPADGFDNAATEEKMSQLVHSLEQLSTSIENLHSSDKSKAKSANPEI